MQSQNYKMGKPDKPIKEDQLHLPLKFSDKCYCDKCGDEICTECLNCAMNDIGWYGNDQVE